MALQTPPQSHSSAEPFSLPRRNPEAPSRAQPLWVTLALVALIVIGGWIRTIDLTEKSLWQDEIFTLASATGNNLFEATIRPDDVSEETGQAADPETPQSPSYYLEQVTRMQPDASFWTALSRNIQTPLYPLLMRSFVSQFGPDPVSLRWFSVLAGTLVIPVAFGLGRHLRGPRFGLLLAALVALSGFQVTYSQTARVYAFVTLEVVLSTWMMLKLLTEKGQRPLTWVLFALPTLAGLYTQYLYHFVLGFQALYVLLMGRPDRRFLGKMALTAVVVGLAYLPWLPMFQAQQAFLQEVGHGNLKGLWNPVSLIERLWNILTEQIAPKSIPTKILATAIVAAGLFTAWRQRQPLWLFALGGLWLACIVGGLMGIDLVSQTHRILSKRYTILASPALYLLLAASLWVLPRRWAFGLGASLLALMTWNSLEVVAGPKFLAKENYRQAGRWITEQTAQRPTGGDLVLVSHSGVHATGMAFYLPDSVKMLGISRRNPENPWQPAELAAHLDRVTAPYQRVWLVYTHSPKPLRQSITDWTEGHFKQVARQKFSSVEVSLYQKP